MSNPIGYCNETLNPARGCVCVSPGCQHCYARTMTQRFGKEEKAWDGTIRLQLHTLNRIGHWRKRRVCFLGDMTDLFQKDMPPHVIIETLARVRTAPQHIFLFLTKRPERMWQRLREEPVLSNVWCGATCEDQTRLVERAPHMAALAKSGWHTWASCEPLLGILDWSQVTWRPRWIVIGGENGTGARKMFPGWAQRAAIPGVPLWFKGWGSAFQPCGPGTMLQLPRERPWLSTRT